MSINFTKEELLKRTHLGGRVILIEMPRRTDDKNAIHTFKEWSLFANMILSNEKYDPHSVSGISVNGIVAVTFGETSASDDKLRDLVAFYASLCLFE